MTTVISWCSKKEIKDPDKGHGEKKTIMTAVYLASDSRYTKTGGQNWDFGRKLFFSKSRPDIFGYTGDVIFPITILGQLCDLIDGGYFSETDANHDARLQTYKSFLDDSFSTFPDLGGCSIIYATRTGIKSDAKFHVWKIDYLEPGKAGIETGLFPHDGGLLLVPSHDTEIEYAFGSGNKSFKDGFLNMNKNEPDQKHTTRAIAWAFFNSLQSGADQYTGGAPQAVCLNGEGGGNPVGFCWNEERYLLGSKLNGGDVSTLTDLDWRNDEFVYYDPVDMKPMSGAKTHKPDEREEKPQRVIPK